MSWLELLVLVFLGIVVLPLVIAFVAGYCLFWRDLWNDWFG